MHTASPSPAIHSNLGESLLRADPNTLKLDHVTNLEAESESSVI
jgi:hypothetical protein